VPIRRTGAYRHKKALAIPTRRQLYHWFRRSLRKRAPALHVLHAKFGRSRSNGMNVKYGDPPEKWPIAPHLSRSLKVIGTNADRLATYDFLLCDRNNFDPTAYERSLRSQ